MEEETRPGDVWHQALVDNTAQGISDELEKLENLPQYQKRWIWELSQNALDSANGKVAIQIELNGKEVHFRHDGHPFSEKEIAHLIYHGSTKRGEAGKLGKFGTGFLTTHLLSKITTVAGITDTNLNFKFKLDRSGQSIKDLTAAMEKSRGEFHGSLLSGLPSEVESGFTTQYSYYLDDNGEKVAQTGIEDLRKIAGYVVALNDEIKSIVLINENNNESFTKISEKAVSEANDLQIVEIEHKRGDLFDSPIIILIANDKNVSIGITLTKENEQLDIKYVKDIPKLFIAFPLFGTEDFPFPAIINCRYFIPMEDRDGIYLQQKVQDANTNNKAIINRAIPLLLKIINHALSQKWNHIYELTTVDTSPNKNWLDSEWCNGILKELINNKFMELALVKSKNNWITPKMASICFPKESKDLWTLSAALYEDQLPIEELNYSWSIIIELWSGILGIKPEVMIQTLTIEKLAKRISDFKTLQNLNNQIQKDLDGKVIIEPIDWLNKFINLIITTEKNQLLDVSNLLPNQNGYLKTRSNGLKSDPGIDDVLKDISKIIGSDVRDNLLDIKAAAEVKKLLTEMTQDELLNQIIKTIKEMAKSQPNSEHFEKANLQLFNWLVNNKKYELLKDYPVYSRRTNDKNEELITYIGRKEGILAPVERWSEKSRIFVSLFPQELIISSKYALTNDVWDILQSQNLLMCETIFYKQRTINEDELRNSLSLEDSLDEENEHTISNINMSNIAFLKEDTVGIIDRVRNSKIQARLFVKFLMEFVVDFDDKSLEPVEQACQCGKKHKVYSLYWLIVLKTQKWIPAGKNKQDFPSSKNLADLFQNQSDILNTMIQDRPSKLLNMLNTSVSDIMKFIVGKDEKTKLELDKATGKLYRKFSQNPEQLTGLATLVDEEPSFIQEFQLKLEQKAKIRKNQLIGGMVEKIFRSLFEEKDLKKEGFDIDRTGVGSDYAVEYDFIEEGKEQQLEIKKGSNKFLIELKSTYENSVKMTSTQGKKAANNQENYALCVVTLAGNGIDESNVRQNSRFVVDIGNKLVDKVEKLNEYEQQSTEISSEGGDIAIELNAGQTHFKVSASIWEMGKTFDEFLEYIRNKYK